MFCPGFPGAGKTILASIAIQHLHNLFGNDDNTGIAYYYCDFRQQEIETPNMILSSILTKLVQCSNSLPNAIKTLYDKHKKNGTRLSLMDISSSLESVTSLYSRTFIVIDGLDECLVWGEVMAYLRVLPGVNILTTCRDYSEIVDDLELRGGTSLEVRATDTDMRRYLDRSMWKLARVVRRDQDLRDDISNSILAASGGM